MVDNTDGHQLLSVVAAIHHQRVGKTLNDWALCLPEALLGVSSGRVGGVDWRADLNVITVKRVSPMLRNFAFPAQSLISSTEATFLRLGNTHVNEISRISTSS